MEHPQHACYRLDTLFMHAFGHLPSCGLALLGGLLVILSTRTAAAQRFEDVSHLLGPPLVQHASSTDDCSAQTIECIAPQTGGVAVGDYDADGDVDIFLTRFGLPDVLLEHQADGTFMDVAELVGVAYDGFSNGAAFLDVDNDGDLDLIVTRAVVGSHALFVNDGVLHTETGRPWFRDEGLARGVAADPSGGTPTVGFGIAAGDYDRDGWPDLYVTDWVGPVAQCGAEHSRLLRNVGPNRPGYFEDATYHAGVTLSDPTNLYSWSFAGSFRDLDADGFQDLIVVADLFSARLFWNAGSDRFYDGTAEAGVGSESNAMGSTFADYDRDGDLDWFVGSVSYLPPVLPPHLEGSRIYRNDGSRRFTDVTDIAGVRDAGWAWGSVFFDADNDGRHDLYIVNGFEVHTGVLDVSRYYHQGSSGAFVERGSDAGLSDDSEGRGLATLDFDQDGYLDLLVVRNGDSPRLLRNVSDAPRNDWLRVRVEGRAGNRDGLGALVRARRASSNEPWMLESVDSNTDFLAQSERVAHFGLGPGFAVGGTGLDIEVTFLSGHVVERRGVHPNQVVTVVEPLTPGPLGPVRYVGVRCESSAYACSIDCDANGLADSCEIDVDGSLDCDTSGVIDACEIELGFLIDCNLNGVPDSCERREEPSSDANANGVLDDCESTVDGGIGTEVDHGLPASTDGGAGRLSGGCSSGAAASGDFGYLLVLGWLLVVRHRAHARSLKRRGVPVLRGPRASPAPCPRTSGSRS